MIIFCITRSGLCIKKISSLGLGLFDQKLWNKGIMRKINAFKPFMVELYPPSMRSTCTMIHIL